MQLARFAPGPRHALLASVGEGHGPGPGRETEADLPAGSEKCRHAGERRCGFEHVIRARQCRGKARHAAGPGGLADSGPFRDLLRALAPSALGRELGAADADLAEVLLVRGHRGDGGALGRLQLSTQGFEVSVAQPMEHVGFDAVADRGKLHPCALYSEPVPASRRARVHLLYYARNRHRMRGRQSPWLRYSTTSSASSGKARSSRSPSTTPRRTRSTA